MGHRGWRETFHHMRVCARTHTHVGTHGNTCTHLYMNFYHVAVLPIKTIMKKEVGQIWVVQGQPLPIICFGDARQFS